MQSVKPVKVSGYIPSELHSKLEYLAKERETTIGVLVSVALRNLFDPLRPPLGAIPLDGRTARAKKLKAKTTASKLRAH